MDRLLKQGDVFMFDGKVNLIGEVVHSPPGVNFDRLSTTNVGDGVVAVMKHETKPGGWERTSWVKVDTKAPDKYRSSKWRVLTTCMTGGGTGHGPGDVYPDGHRVEAQRVGRVEKVYFYQTGCFIGMVDQKDVKLVREKKT